MASLRDFGKHMREEGMGRGIDDIEQEKGLIFFQQDNACITAPGSMMPQDLHNKRDRMITGQSHGNPDMTSPILLLNIICLLGEGEYCHSHNIYHSS